MVIPHLLSVGYDPLLMRTRSFVLRQAGFTVDEAYNLNGALGLLMSDSIDAVLLCHTVPKDKQRSFIQQRTASDDCCPSFASKPRTMKGTSMVA